MRDVLAVILGGGRGSRLFPLTQRRSKPAVPIAGKYRLIDIPVSNCLHSNLRRIWVVTQYNSESLNRHLAETYKFDMFSSGFVSVLAAEQTEESPDWFQGTADAVRQSMRYLRGHAWTDVLILSGDQLYQMDFRKMLEAHRQQRADVSVAVKPVGADQASGFGILRMDAHQRITQFYEKPAAGQLGGLASELASGEQAYLASMGIYLFRREVLEQVMLEPGLVDFGGHVIPWATPRLRVQAFPFRGYWEDVGTIGSYYHANLALCESVPPFDFYDASHPVYTHARFLPATKIGECNVRDSLVTEGGILVGATLDRSVIGIRSRIGRGSVLRNTLMLGADYYENLQQMELARSQGLPPVGVGEDCHIEKAILDKNVRIGRGVRILNEGGAETRDGDGWYVRDGIVIVTKGAEIPDGTII